MGITKLALVSAAAREEGRSGKGWELLLWMHLLYGYLHSVQVFRCRQDWSCSASGVWEVSACGALYFCRLTW